MGKQSGTQADTGSRAVWLYFALAMALGFCLLAQRMGAPYDGYLAYNEGWYSIVAQNYERHSLLEPTAYDGTLDLRIPPLFSWALYGSMRVFGRHEWAFRLVTVAAGMLCLAAVFLIGRLLHGDRAGLWAALLLALSPMFVVVSRNVQTDAMFTMFCLWGLYLFLLYRRGGAAWRLHAAAACFGLALMTKQFAALALGGALCAAAAERRFRFRITIHGVVAGCVFGVVGLSNYVYQATVHAAALHQSNMYHARDKLGVESPAALWSLLREMASGFGPALTILGLMAAAGAISRRKRQDPYIAFTFIIFIVSYFIVHKHDYYVFGAIPFLAVMGGETLAAARRPAAVGALAAGIVVVGLTTVMMSLGRNKFGYDRFRPICEYLDGRPGRTVLVLTPTLASRYAPAVHYYCRKTRVFEMDNPTCCDSSRWERMSGVRADNHYRLSFDSMLLDRSANVVGRYPQYAAGPSIFGFLMYSAEVKGRPVGGDCRDGSFLVSRGPAFPALEIRNACVMRRLLLTKESRETLLNDERRRKRVARGGKAKKNKLD